jgi:hypothetical protein
MDVVGDKDNPFAVTVALVTPLACSASSPEASPLVIKPPEPALDALIVDAIFYPY